jgi:hypothetical protein
VYGGLKLRYIILRDKLKDGIKDIGRREKNGRGSLWQ